MNMTADKAALNPMISAVADKYKVYPELCLLEKARIAK
jgi:hypothetical protein